MYVYTFYIKCSVYNIYVYVYNWVVKRNYSLTSICRRRLCLLSHPGDLSAFILIKQVALRFVEGFLYMVFLLFLEIMKFFLRNNILQIIRFRPFSPRKHILVYMKKNLHFCPLRHFFVVWLPLQFQRQFCVQKHKTCCKDLILQ